MKVGVAFSQQLNADGGLPGGAYSFALAVGAALPPGLTLDAGGLLHGTPTGAGRTRLGLSRPTPRQPPMAGPFSAM